jgi:branched-chain amino acid transport system ATP-binding protein
MWIIALAVELPVLLLGKLVGVEAVSRGAKRVVMVEQNARRCLQICDRGYVLDQGRNAYTGTGEGLLTDPKVVELYLGTLAKVD